MAFLKAVVIDFNIVECVLEEQGTRIDWDTADEDTREWIYDIINDDCVVEIEQGRHADSHSFVQWIIEQLLRLCEANSVTVLSLDPSGNVIEPYDSDEGQLIYEEHQH